VQLAAFEKPVPNAVYFDDIVNKSESCIRGLPWVFETL